MAPTRSVQGARLMNTHHTTIANTPMSPPITPNIMVPGTTMGTTNLTSSNSTAATTPGHSRSGLRFGSSVCAIVILRSLSSPEQVSEFGQFLFVEIGDDAIAQSIRIAVDDRIAAMLLQIRFSVASVLRGPDEDIDKM